jgi:Glycosyl transferases group 1
MSDKKSKTSFEHDQNPNLPKILFIGIAQSTHTHAWIDLLDKEAFNVRLFSTPGSLLPPDNWKTKTYVTKPSPPNGLNPQFRNCYYPTPEQRRNPFVEFMRVLNAGFMIDPLNDGTLRALKISLYMLFYLPTWLIVQFKKIESRFFRKNREETENRERENFELVCSKWLSAIISEWQPDIIHTLGIFDSQGGEFFLNTQKRFGKNFSASWIVHTRGGSDMALNQFSSTKRPILCEVLKSGDYIISDNENNVQIASRLGIEPQKFLPLTPIPGSGGIDTKFWFSLADVSPSRRQRIILLPKAYESTWSKALPVMEALKTVWDETAPFDVFLLACDEEVSLWITALPEGMRKHFHIMPRIPRDEVFSLLLKARIMLAPSLIDGIPNVLYEAMACGAFPIISPLETVKPFATEDRNVLFARNLYPNEIAMAVLKALNDDEFVDRVAKNNRDLIKNYADRKVIKRRVADFYQSVLKQS